MITVGVDPDSEKHGVAIYHDAKLTSLQQLSLMEIFELVQGLSDVMFSIENVLANGFIYRQQWKENLAAQGKVGMSVGRCMQAQQELMRMLDHFDIPYVLHKPQKGNWAENKSQFEYITQWTGRSNKDQRSAAFFGFLAIPEHRRRECAQSAS